MQEDLTALRTKFLDSLEAIGVDEAQVVMDNQPSADVDEGRVWVRFTIRPGEKRASSFGKRKVMTQIGEIILQVFAPIGSGAAAIYEIAGAFNTAYEDWVVRDESGSIRTYYSKLQDYPSQTGLQVNAIVYYESNRRQAI